MRLIKDEYSMYIIKPEGMEYRKGIRTIIQKELSIICFNLISVNSNLIECVYNDSPTYVRKAQKELLNESVVEAGIVTGPQAIRKLFEISGEFADPRMCKKGTIRNTYGEETPVNIGGVEIFRNSIHRPKDALEAERHTQYIARRIFEQD